MKFALGYPTVFFTARKLLVWHFSGTCGGHLEFAGNFLWPCTTLCVTRESMMLWKKGLQISSQQYLMIVETT